MTSPRDIDERLEQGLRRVASWEGERPEPALWERAADAARTTPAAAPPRHRRHWRIGAGVAGVVAVVALALMLQTPHLGRTWRSAGLIEGDLAVELRDGAAEPARPASVPAMSPARGEVLSIDSAAVTYALPPPHQAPEPLSAVERHVVRKATMELKTTDVRGAFLKATLISNAAAGEFVEDSGLTGEGKAVSGNLTLRVAAERLPEVLNQLRELGEVTSEAVRGDDVTAQVVDLEARLRNERRVEQELLELLAARQDAPLKDILELRTALGGVRNSIERMQGQRETLSRLVSLATVLVLIRPDGAPPPERSSILTHLGASFGTAWRSGLEFLIDSSATIVKVALGGLIWWAIAIIAVVLIRRHLRRAALLRGEV